MALDEVRQALLDVFCHCYGLLLRHLDYLNGAVGAHRGWDGYRLVRECVDTAANRLGSSSPETTDRRALCKDFLRRVRGAMEHNLRADSPAFAAFSDYAAAVETTSDVPCTDLTEWQRVGEELSRACYCRRLPADAPALSISVEKVELTPMAKMALHAEPQKKQGQGKITFGFSPDCFIFAEYVNLPFYFFHEYLSHLHSAPMFSEHCGSPDHPFTEGWLMYYARLAYQRALFHESHPALGHPLHRDHYVARYLHNALDKKTHTMTCRGYELARQFTDLVGEARFEQATLLVASTPYDVFTPLAPDLHGEFVRRAWRWLRRVTTLSPQEREGRVATLDALLDRHSPVHGLMEWLDLLILIY